MAYERVLNLENPFRDDDSATLYDNTHNSDDNIATSSSQSSGTHDQYDNLDNKSEVTHYTPETPKASSKSKHEDDDDEDIILTDANGDFIPVSNDESSTEEDDDPFSDDFGNSYQHVDFDNKRYTSRLTFKGSRLVYFTSGFVSLFLALFGAEQASCSGLIVFDTFNKYFNHPSAATIGVVVSILEIGAMLSSLSVAKISDLFGRKRTILTGTLLFMIGGSLQTFCPNMFVFGVGRVFSGFGVGILSTVVPSYQCEISPSEDRGKLVCAEFTGNIAGYALSVWINYFCYFIQDIGDTRDKPHSFLANLSWRLPLFIQVVIAFVLFLGGFFIVESPRWLLDNDMDQQGFHVLALLYDSSSDDNKPRTEFFMIKNNILQERETTPKLQRTWRHLLSHFKIRVFVACSALIFAQFNGINIISYYAPLVFEQAGFNNSSALLMTGINGIVYLLSTIPTWFLVDRWGRRPILITSGVAMGICLFLVAVFMLVDKSYTPILVAILVVIYNASFGFGFGPIPFLLLSESYPLSVRSKGASLAVACNWFSNFVVGLMTPILKELIKWAMYLFPASSCVMSVVVVMLFYPETKGVELEEIDRVFEEFYATSTFKRVKIKGLRRRKSKKNKNKGKYSRLQDDAGASAFELDEMDYENRALRDV
ncbi:Sugar transporter STL1 [Candida viswanathii]|uniref:Sugar transporter STL1 n=1 Tax=Candida viswanathii TaxID=5486 RepID=A0A367YEV6_9ASCO|nr:Sugar transporter STL1 [Candida viswanathii]